MGVIVDWSNERYVRIYTRDSITWKRLGWKGQTVLMHVTRRLDRSGVLDLNGVSPYEAVELVTDLPSEVIEDGLSKCLELEVFIEDDGRLLMPNYLPAQEAVASNAERQRRWRSKKRGTNNSNETSTNSNKTSTDRNESNVTRNENNPVLNHPCLTNRTNQLPDSPESVSRQIKELESRYDADLIRETRDACALSRKSGRMADSAWLKVLERLGKHSVDDVAVSARTFVDRHADGQKDENYLLGIVRGQGKKKKSSGGLFDSGPVEEPYFDNERFGRPDGAER